MRISDWSSDVCSSDLQDIGGIGAHLTIDQVHLDLSVKHGELDRLAIITLIIDRQTKLILGHALMASCGGGEEIRLARSEERREGKSGSVRLDLGGLRVIKK